MACKTSRQLGQYWLSSESFRPAMPSNTFSQPWFRRLVVAVALLSFLLLVLFPPHYHLHHDHADPASSNVAATIDHHGDHHLDLHLTASVVDELDHYYDNHVVSPNLDAGTQTNPLKLPQLLAILTLLVLIVLHPATLHRWLPLRDSGSPRSPLRLTPPLRAPPRD
ncbi:MAG: hypothetical protein MI756_12710 [Chromatiales bacterium]|nr:hypothetical protein [Chromatiales bacterium]